MRIGATCGWGAGAGTARGLSCWLGARGSRRARVTGTYALRVARPSHRGAPSPRRRGRAGSRLHRRSGDLPARAARAAPPGRRRGAGSADRLRQPRAAGHDEDRRAALAATAVSVAGGGQGGSHAGHADAGAGARAAGRGLRRSRAQLRTGVARVGRFRGPRRARGAGVAWHDQAVQASGRRASSGAGGGRGPGLGGSGVARARRRRGRRAGRGPRAGSGAAPQRVGLGDRKAPEPRSVCRGGARRSGRVARRWVEHGCRGGQPRAQGAARSADARLGPVREWRALSRVGLRPRRLPSGLVRGHRG